MLSRHIAQPPRRFEPVDASAGGRTACTRCVTDVFNTALQHSLIAAAKDESSLSRQYSCIASDVYASMLEGCRWCASIGNAILTSADLDYWTNDWQGSRSDGDSLMGSGDDEEGGLEEGSASDDDEGSDGKSEGSAAGKPGFLTIKALDCSARLDVTVEFVKWDGSTVFNLLDATVEVVQTREEDSVLPGMAGEGAVHLRFEVMSPDMAEGIFPRTWAIVSAASDDWSARAEAWLQICRGHASCESTANFQPTRLIDVRNQKRLRLVTRDDAAPSQPYASLSYVWGSAQPYVLTRETLGQMHIGLDSSRLPGTIADAINVARRMGFEYLWVDALCIIQDSLDDKLKELPVMSDIYRESSLTILAASASSASEGFLRVPEPVTFFVDPFRIELSAEDGPPASLAFGYRQTYKATADPINSRAWTLQERVLSPRLLIFSNGGVLWMCRECHVNPSAAPDAGPPYQTSLGPDVGEKKADETRLREQWMAIRADYTEMDLSYCSDKLPAISALAADVSRRAGWTYLAGLWKENLFSELHWRSVKRTLSGENFLLKSQKAREAGYIAPSWSWASIGLGMIVDSEDERVDRDVFHFEVLDCHVETVGNANFQFGPIKGGFLLVEGKVIELPWRLEDRPDWDGSDIALLDTEEDEDGQTLVVGDGTIDPLDDHLQPNTKLVCLGMSRLRLGRQRIVPVEGMLLLPTGPGGAFRRVGFFRMTAPSVFDEVHTRVLRIE